MFQLRLDKGVEVEVPPEHRLRLFVVDETEFDAAPQEPGQHTYKESHLFLGAVRIHGYYDRRGDLRALGRFGNGASNDAFVNGMICNDFRHGAGHLPRSPLFASQ
jgi:hypothetical protein